MAPLVLELRGITKRFPGILANDAVDFDLRSSEVHALLGENGAGKSTLMNVLYGLYRQDGGDILVNGRLLHLDTPRAAIDAGVGMVHQHFMLIPVMTVAENIVLASEPKTRGVLLDYDAARARVRDLSQQFGLAVDPEARIENITVGQQQRVEILKALYRGADILILDEPTAVLTPQEAGELFEVIESLKAQGKSIIFISHKLNEVLEIADRITVLRRGKMIETVPREGATEESLARSMVGREVLLRVEKRPARPREPLPEDENVRVLEGDWHATMPAEAPFDLLFYDGGGKQRPDLDGEDVVGLLAPCGLVVMDDLWPGRPVEGDPVREFWLGHPDLVATELTVAPSMAVIVGVRVR